MKRWCALLGALPCLAAWDAETARGFEHFYNLEFDDAVAVFRALARAHAGTARYHNHLAQAILYREMLNSGALETELVTGGNAFLRREKMKPSAADEKEFLDSIETVLRLCAAAREKDCLYASGAAYGLRGNYNFLVRKAWMDALRDATESRKLHNRVTAMEPSFVDARLTQGVHDYIIGSLPWTYKFLGFLAGFRGDKDTGIATLNEVWKKGDRNRADAGILLATVYRREKRPADAVPLLQSLIAEFPRNYLFRFELAQMYSDLGKKDPALDAIAEVEKLKRGGTRGYERLPVEKILYFRATVQFWYRDIDASLENFRRVTARAADLDPNTGVTAWMRLGQAYDLKGQRQQAVEAYRKAIAYAPGSYRARESEGYLRTPYRRS